MTTNPTMAKKTAHSRREKINENQMDRERRANWMSNFGWKYFASFSLFFFSWRFWMSLLAKTRKNGNETKRNNIIWMWKWSRNYCVVLFSFLGTLKIERTSVTYTLLQSSRHATLSSCEWKKRCRKEKPGIPNGKCKNCTAQNMPVAMNNERRFFPSSCLL